MRELGSTIGYCLVPFLFCLAGYLRAGKGKNPWILIGVGAVITVLASLGSFANGGFGIKQILSIIIVAVFGGLTVSNNK